MIGSITPGGFGLAITILGKSIDTPAPNPPPTAVLPAGVVGIGLPPVELPPAATGSNAGLTVAASAGSRVVAGVVVGPP